MDYLKVKDNLIVNESGNPVRLRGFNIGGWMNMEDFIDGFTGAEHNLRQTFARVLGVEKARFFFDRMLDYFFSEEDVAHMQSLGANALRIPINYRHFERDEAPFEYLEEGFRRLDQAVSWCAQHGIYAIIDLHAVPGWHNPDWHSDNAHVHILVYRHKLFQDRVVALWKALAEHYREEPAVAGYDLMNEPCTRLEYERYDPSYYDWNGLNSLHRRIAQAIRSVDTKHILFVEGDNFATQYDGLETEFDANLVLSTHNYTSPTIGPGAYPGEIHGQYWNRDILAAEFGMHSGVRLAFQRRLPLLAGEFGVWYAARPEELHHRVAALDDQLGVFNSAAVHWTIWTYKDIGAMGAMNVSPQSDYLQLIRPVLQAKQQLADWEGEIPASTVARNMKSLADSIDAALLELGLPFPIERRRFAQFSLFGYLAQFLQVPYAHLFKGLSETEIDRLLQAFSFKNCIPNQPLLDVLKKNMA